MTQLNKARLEIMGNMCYLTAGTTNSGHLYYINEFLNHPEHRKQDVFVNNRKIVFEDRVACHPSN